MNAISQLIGPAMTAFWAALTPILAVFVGLYKAFTWLLFVPLDKAIQHTPLGAVLRRYTHDDDIIDHMARETMAMKECAGDLLVHGKRREYAETRLPPAKHPSWYINVPQHLRRSIVAHGRIRETKYAPADALAGGSLTEEFVQRAWRAAVHAGVRAGWVVFLIVAILAWKYGDMSATWSSTSTSDASAAYSQRAEARKELAGLEKRFKEDGPQALSPEEVAKVMATMNNMERQVVLQALTDPEDRKYVVDAMKSQQQQMQQQRQAAAAPAAGSTVDAMTVARNYNDVWGPADADAVNAKLHAAGNVGHLGAKWAGKTATVVAVPLRLALLVLTACLAGLAAGRMTFIGRLRWLVYDAVNRTVRDFRKPFREALQKWRYFLKDRDINTKGWNDQVNFVTTIDRSPLVYFGDGEGSMEFAGHILGPREGHEFKQSICDMFQHTKVLGGSGESKSRDWYLPVAAQLLEYRKQGYPIGFFLTDDKGVIVKDIQMLAAKLGLEKDLLIIGTAKGEWRVDLMEIGKPFLVAEFIKSAAAQAGKGGGGDDFWLEMGNDLALNIWTLTEAAQHLKAGKEWEAENRIRYHSLKNMLSLAISDEQLEETIAMVSAALKSPEEYEKIAKLDDEALHSAIEYLLDQWLPMADVTRDGIKANLRKALRTFTFKPEVSRGFADGAGEHLLSASKMHSNLIKALNVSQIEHGSAGRLVNIMLKSAFFKQCRDVEQQDPAFSKKRQAWWFNPVLTDPDKDLYFCEFFIGDEYQNLITADPTSGYSDLTVHNVLRSACCAVITISQGVGAYEAAVGKEATANILRQWRSAHFLRTEDVATIEEAKKLLGKTMRFHVSDWGHYESMAAVRNELGADPDNLAQVAWLPSYDEPVLLGRSLHADLDFGTWDNAFALDERFVLESSALGAQGPNAVNAATSMATKQSAAWRMEDRQTQAMQHGVLDTEALRDEQIMQMTRGRSATLLQVGGGTQCDIIRLNARAYKRYTDEDLLMAA